MQKVNFYIYDQLGDQIDAAIEKWGYLSRAEFFRTLAIDFLQKQASLLPPEDVIKNYTKAVERVRRSRGKKCFWPEGPLDGLAF
jgi:metal-responsive CopG/Arc/MetJ family transcriptional regulator